MLSCLSLFLVNSLGVDGRPRQLSFLCEDKHPGERLNRRPAFHSNRFLIVELHRLHEHTRRPQRAHIPPRLKAPHWFVQTQVVEPLCYRCAAEELATCRSTNRLTRAAASGGLIATKLASMLALALDSLFYSPFCSHHLFQ